MPRVDIAILTVIPEEYAAVIASLAAHGCKTEHDPGTATTPNQFGWVTGDLAGSGNQIYRVAVGMVVRPGPGRMASAVSATCARFRPQYVLIVGIAGGFPLDGLRKGDVALSSVIYDYEYGKVVADDFHPRPDFTYPVDQGLLASAVSLHVRDKSWAERDKQLRPDAEGIIPKLLHGAIASGGKIIDDATNEFFAAVLREWPKLLAVEMEGAGAAEAIETAQAAKLNVGFIMVRGISDMPKIGDGPQSSPGSPEGNKAERDQWKLYAATTAANFTVHWIARAWPLAPRPKGRSGTSSGPDAEDGGDPPGASQQASIGNVSGSNNTVSITQNQGPTLEEFNRLLQAVAPPDAHAEIEAACKHLTGGDLSVAIYLLEDLKKRRGDKLSPREKYRVEANIGLAMERKGEFKKAAQHYIEAQRHQPQEDRARALEAIAYYHLDDKPKAHALAVEAVKDHPNCALAHAVRIRSAPPEVSVAELEASVPEQLREEVEILHALGWFALSAGDVVAAERFATTARSRYPDSVEIKDHHATVIVQIEGRARQANQPVNREKLEEAVRNLTEGINKSRGYQDEARLRYNRAEAYDLLGQTEDAETDYRHAIDADKSEPDITRRFVLFLMRHDRTTSAIDALRKADKVKQNHTNRLMLAGLLGERKAPGDWDAAIALLRETIPQKPEPETRAAMVATLTQLLGLQKKHDEAAAFLDSLGDGFLGPAVLDATRAMVLLRAGQKDDARTVALCAMQLLDDDSPETDWMRVAEALGYAGAKAEALSIWKQILEPDSADVFVCTALEFARETGDDAFIRDFCRGLRTRGVRHPFTLELEVMTLEKYSAYDEAVSVMQGYVATHPDDDLARVFRVRMSLLGVRLNRPALIEADVAKLLPVESVPVKIGAATAHVLRNGPCPMRGVKYAYELVRRYFGDPLARRAYVAVVGVGDDEELFPLPPVAAPGCAVRYRADDTGEVNWAILEDSPGPSSDREEFGPESRRYKDLSGKAVGEKFDLRRGSLQDRTATIEFIGSKYKYRAVEIMQGWEKRFPERPFAQKFTIPTKEDGSPDVSLLLEALDEQERQKEVMHEIYRNNPISATTFAKFTDAGLLESLNHLASDGTLPIRCCRGAVGELEGVAEALSSNAPVVIEPSALATLFFSDQYEQLKLLAGRCVICEGALKEYVELRQKFSSGSRGFVSKFKGQYQFREDDPPERERQVQRLDKFLSEIRPLVTMKSGESLADLPADKRDELIKIFGQPTAEAIAVAKATGAVLWTDDIAVAEITRQNLGVEKRVWTQAVFKLVAPPEVFADITMFLLHWRYFFTRLEPEVVIAACRKASWNPEDPSVLRIVDWLKMPELLPDGAVQMCAISLRLIWKEGIEVAQKQGVAKALLGAILARQDGRQAVAFIRGGLKEIMQGDHAARRQCEKVIEEILRVKIGPGTESSKAAWASVLRQMARQQTVQKSGPSKQSGGPTPKQRAEQRRADRKRKKGR